jgi:glycine/D-amino acid oxidase-like deaminating enzyme
MQRRTFLKDAAATASLLALAGCAARKPITAAQNAPQPLPFYDALPPIVPIRAHADRLFRITVCLRPFRAAGPRLDAERVGDKLVVHNYGHGGSGWSLSWGSSRIAVTKALFDGEKEVAVLGCGALGLTSAITAQRMGARVTIYCKERPPEVRSSRATGGWTPDSRIALADKADASFPALWEQMARTSWSTYQGYLGLPGDPIEFTDRYRLYDEDDSTKPEVSDGIKRLEFASYGSRIRDITPRWVELPPGSHPFPTKHARRNSALTFNVADYSRQLLNDFLIAGGKIEMAEFRTPADLATLPQKVVINCTGYGARALWSDETVVPVRGQIGWLIPQEGVHYGLYYKDIGVLARRDGIVVQGNILDDMYGYNNSDETPNRPEAEAAVQTLVELYSRMATQPNRKS